MARPDLSTSEGLTAYRQELRGVAQPVRFTAFGLVLLGAAVVVAAVWLELPDWAVNGGYIALGVGWVLMVSAVFLRTRYHRRRMAEPE
jgi:protein-S-isoprenylcysteine O-methyltransferase Ste14